MRNLILNWDTLIKVPRALSRSRDTEEIIRMSVESIKSVLDIKGCVLFLINRHYYQGREYVISYFLLGKGLRPNK